jgi:microcystin-dependent protein
MTSTLRTNAALTARNKPLTGDTKTSFVIDDHMGWMKCDGRLLDKITYNLLFQVIGYTFGGSGANFKLPDPQGRVMGSVGPVVDENEHTHTYAPGDSVGELDHQLTIPEMPSHNHNNNTPAQATTNAGYTSSYTHNHGGSTGNAGSAEESETVIGSVAAVNSTAIVAGSGTHSHTIAADTHSHTIASNGGDQYHNNVPPTLFYGNTFIYSGIPTMGSYPYTTGKNPVLI